MKKAYLVLIFSLLGIGMNNAFAENAQSGAYFYVRNETVNINSASQNGSPIAVPLVVSRNGSSVTSSHTSPGNIGEFTRPLTNQATVYISQEGAADIGTQALVSVVPQAGAISFMVYVTNDGTSYQVSCEGQDATKTKHYSQVTICLYASTGGDGYGVCQTPAVIPIKYKNC